jgi:uncharacterized protein YukE
LHLQGELIMPAQQSKDADSMAKGIMCLDEAANKIRSIGTYVQNNRETFAAHWTGGASQSFDKALIIWLEDFQEILKNIDNLRETLAGVDKNWDNTEQDNSRNALQWINGILDGTPGVTKTGGN